jgi:hypothetical protein
MFTYKGLGEEWQETVTRLPAASRRQFDTGSAKDNDFVARLCRIVGWWWHELDTPVGLWHSRARATSIGRWCRHVNGLTRRWQELKTSVGLWWTRPYAAWMRHPSLQGRIYSVSWTPYPNQRQPQSTPTPINANPNQRQPQSTPTSIAPSSRKENQRGYGKLNTIRRYRQDHAC